MLVHDSGNASDAPGFNARDNCLTVAPCSRAILPFCHSSAIPQPFSLKIVVPAKTMAEGESEHDGALKRYVAKVQEHREFESRVKKLRETATWKPEVGSTWFNG